MKTRGLGRSGLDVGAMGLGCWAIGGSFWDRGGYMGYGDVDDTESVRALHRALELGIRFFDVAGVYGCGHAESLLGQVLHETRAEVIIAAKFGYTFTNTPPEVTGTDISPTGIRYALEQSLKRLKREKIDIYQLHLFDLPLIEALEVAGTLDDLVQEGLIDTYSWCNELPEALSAFARDTQASVVPILLNVLEGNRELPALCADLNLGVMVRRPLGMGLLTGKLQAGHTFADNDMRTRFKWNFETGKQAKQLQQLRTIKELLCTDGRTLAQGALAWLWAFHPSLVPIPGFKTVMQVEENVAAMNFGALPPAVMLEIQTLMNQ
jgi:aryl-alcohol dehydrogenase-like predicted oxidoreductase